MVDHHLGLFMDRLAASGRDVDTAVVITCDHGTNAGAHGLLSKGGPIYEQVGHVVLMVRLPGAQPGRRAGIVQPADLMPTILELADLAVPETCQGQSFAGMLTGAESLGRLVAVSGMAVDISMDRHPLMGEMVPQFTVQDERWCLIDSPDPARQELYDKEVDRQEEHNVIAEHPRVVERLHRALLNFLADHEAHPALVQWFETGTKGDVSDYQYRDPYLRDFWPYFAFALDEELHR
jgi:arylsulfatase A-like enzyme